MLKSLHLTDFTVFRDADLRFGKHLNIVIGENGVGKSHILKAAYCGIAVCAARSSGTGSEPPGVGQLQSALADKLVSVFRPDGLGRLVRRQRGRHGCRVSYGFDKTTLDLTFIFSTVARSEVRIEKVPTTRVEKLPVFLPTRELLTIYPGFVSLYETAHLPFEETWRDTCILLGAPLARGKREPKIKQLLEPLESAMGGSVVLDRSGKFYLNLKTGSMEMDLVAEGLRKLATVARLIATGSLLGKGYLFWDEPESNLNPRIVKSVARTILQVANKGVQVFIATHSLFLLRELHILKHTDFPRMDTRCFGLHLEQDGSVRVEQGRTMDDVGNIAVLDEELEQSDRYMETEMRPGKTD